MWLNIWAETIIDPAEHHYRPSSVHQFPTKIANCCKINDPCKAMNFERTLTTYISSDVMQSKVRWGVPLTLYLVCHRQITKVFTSQWSFQQIKKVTLHASWRSRYYILYIYWLAIRMLLLLSAVGYPRRRVLIRRYVLTWRRNYFG